MAKTKQTAKRSRAKKALPVLGLAGVSMALVGGASASAPTADTPSQNTTARQQIFLGEEELSDVSLATFYVQDKENTAKPQSGAQLAWWRCGGGCGDSARRLCLARLRWLRRLRRLLLVVGTLPPLLRARVPTTSKDMICHGRVWLDPANTSLRIAA